MGHFVGRLLPVTVLVLTVICHVTPHSPGDANEQIKAVRSLSPCRRLSAAVIGQKRRDTYGMTGYVTRRSERYSLPHLKATLWGRGVVALRH